MVLDLGLAVWELAVQHMRAFMKRELEVIFREILLPVLESKSSASLYQRGRVVQTLVRLLSQPALVVELFLNYDCAEDASVNVFQRLAEVLCKLGGNYVTVPKNSPHFALNTESAEGAAMTSAAWHAVQQKQTVFNMPVSLVLRSAGLENSATADLPVANAPTASEAGRPSRTFSISSQSSSVNHMMYGGLNYSASEKQAGGAVIDDYVVRQSALDALAAMLQSMVVWSDRMAGPTIHDSAKPPEDSQADRADSETPVPRKADVPADDPEELSSIKHRKERFEEGRKLFAWKPKKGIEAWKKGGLIRSNDPVEIASFFSTNSGIDKMQLGEFLGEGEPHNIAVMHAFVDMMNFNDMAFVDALRLFLQAFRLPGEAQKIDRFMLKFAERYVMGNPGAGFANADAAYVLAYSTIMLNTDQHSPQVKVRMTRQEFINNNRGINDGKNLDPDLLNGIFDQIVADEIKLKDDPLEGKVDSSQQQQQSGPLFDLWGNGPATRIREQQAHASAEMAAKSEQSLRSMTKMRRRRAVRRPSISVVTNTLNSSPQEQQQAASQAPSLATLDTWAMLLDMSDFLHATRSDHIAPMFGTIWAALLAALSSPMQTAADPHVISACLTGFQCGIALACRFRMPLERATFVTTLRNFTQLQNLAEMKRKHVEAIRALVEVAASRPDVGDGLCESWLDVLQCVSQLERLQLLTQGSDPRASAEHGYTPQSHQQNISARAFAGSTAGTSVVSVAELAKLETNSQVLVVTVDRLFTSSVHLSGSGITDFVRALSDVAWGEIAATYRVDAPSSSATTNNNRRRRESAAQVQVPPARLFSLTKIVEISYYNMERIRVEWSQIWAILGPLFDRVGAYQDTRAALFALDSLRQLSMKFLEKEELPHFAFQKEFLRPFADILEGVVPNAPRPVAVDALVKDMVLRCVRQLVQAAARHIRSGWKAVLNVAQVAARDQSDAIAEMGFQLAKECAEQHGPQMWLLTTASVPQISDATPVEIVAVAGLEYFHELIDCLN
ncbi:guanine nucleotide exchange protein for ADP-robosylation factor, partial [Linderina macrospora]